jgi:hypothetical protein
MVHALVPCAFDCKEYLSFSKWGGQIQFVTITHRLEQRLERPLAAWHDGAFAATAAGRPPKPGESQQDHSQSRVHALTSFSEHQSLFFPSQTFNIIGDNFEAV